MLQITDSEFERIKKIMYKKTGVFLKPTKKPLVITRLRKRLEDMGLEKFADYINLLERPGGEEFEFFINAITTNETYFFRHTKQFNYLNEVIIPEFIAANKGREMRVWSAACSTGEEPYSLAILLTEYAKKKPGFRFKIYASDVNSAVLDICRKGRYFERSMRETPSDIQKKYFNEVEEEGRLKRKMFEVDPGVRAKVEFKQHNLLNTFATRNIDVVFLRNVMIYFDQTIKQKVVSTLQNNVTPDGYLVVSLSESLNDIESEFKFVQSGIYKRQS